MDGVIKSVKLTASLWLVWMQLWLMTVTMWISEIWTICTRRWSFYPDWNWFKKKINIMLLKNKRPQTHYKTLLSLADIQLLSSIVTVTLSFWQVVWCWCDNLTLKFLKHWICRMISHGFASVICIYLVIPLRYGYTLLKLLSLSHTDTEYRLYTCISAHKRCVNHTGEHLSVLSVGKSKSLSFGARSAVTAYYSDWERLNNTTGAYSLREWKITWCN